MERHYLTHTKPHICPQCGKRFSVLRGLIAHSGKHTGKKAHKCSECGTEFAYKSTLDRHMRKHAVEKPFTYTCPLCEILFSGKLEFQRHRCSALKKTFVCSLCPETFECRQSLADHENHHSGDRDFVCEMCGEGFLSFPSLATHRVTHMQKEDCCAVLGLGCSDMRVLKNHLSKHTGEKLFTCEICGKGCSHQSALKHHMLTHTGERPYICETCGKRCSHASALQNHMRIHTGKKPGQKPSCSICSKTFSSTVKLKYHMSVHTGEKPYACNQCEKKFTNPSNLNIHMRIHSGEKMYGCNICGRRFTQSSSLKLHRRIHTGEMVFHCTVCTKGFIYRKDLKNHMKGHLSAETGDGEAEKNGGKNLEYFSSEVSRKEVVRDGEGESAAHCPSTDLIIFCSFFLSTAVQPGHHTVMEYTRKLSVVEQEKDTRISSSLSPVMSFLTTAVVSDDQERSSEL
ncbi:uncharacterized protein FYW49_015933 [Xenentodon cancila]